MSVAIRPSQAARVKGMRLSIAAVMLALLSSPVSMTARQSSYLRQGSAGDYYARAVSHIQAGRYQDALDDFQQVIRLAPNVPDGYYGSGMARLNLNQFREAVLDFEKALRLNPNFAEAYLGESSAYVSLDRYAEV
jgi:tetratricopeptide (TPR) repeat protein